MKKKSTFLSPFICILIAFSLLYLIKVPTSWAKEPKKVAILPFAMHADRDLSFLREGILDMLASRIYWKDKVEVIEKGVVKNAIGDYTGPFNAEFARELGMKLKSDYVLFGSLTVFGEGVSVDATMTSLTKDESPVTVFVQTKGMDLVIPEINDSASELRDVASFVAGELGPETPWHISRFWPAFRVTQVPPTPASTLDRARQIGREAGLHHIYLGNVGGESDTRCHRCGRVLIRRAGRGTFENSVAPDGTCPGCGTALAGVGMAGA